MKELPDNIVDSIVTDPPYELGFMGKKWDGTGIAYSVEMWSDVMRVLKPGGHLLAFGGTRTYHRMACAIEDAGFEIRDQIQWLYGSGFPKSYNISKGIDKRAGAEREVVGEKIRPDGTTRPNAHNWSQEGMNEGWQRPWRDNKEVAEIMHKETAPATPEAQQWDGWGSALKPANEPICLARKPLSEKTIVENVLKWGTGGINVDGCRVGTEKVMSSKGLGNNWRLNDDNWKGIDNKPKPTINTGRFPANLILDEEAGRMLDVQTGVLSKGHVPKKSKGTPFGGVNNTPREERHYGKCGASRFFYCAKSSRKERNAGLEGMEEKQSIGGGGLTSPQNNDGSYIVSGDKGTAGKYGSAKAKAQNHHPTVKPISLMRYLCRLITPPNGTVLDPFTGSGTTGCACIQEGFDFIGIEQSSEYIEIAERRIEYWKTQIDEQIALPI